MILRPLPLPAASDLGIDWTVPETVDGRDPYFIWADVTRRDGIFQRHEVSGSGIDIYPTGWPPRSKEEYTAASGPARAGNKDNTVRILVELKADSMVLSDRSALSVRRLFEVSDLYPARARFVTATMEWLPDAHKFLSGLTAHGVEGVAGFDLGSSVDYAVQPVPQPKGAQSVTDSGQGGASEPTSVGFKFLSPNPEPRAIRHSPPVPRVNMPGREPIPLDGDVLVIIDHGCAFAHELMLDGQGNTRVRFLWDQDERYTPTKVGPFIKDALEKYGVALRPVVGGATCNVSGGELWGEDLDRIIDKNRSNGRIDEAACYEALRHDAMRGSSTHGTHVMSIAAGWPNPADAGTSSPDPAAQAKIVFVQLPRDAIADTSGGSMNVHVLDALRYAVQRTAATANVVVNLSYGTLAGSHDGSSRLERAIDALIEERRNENKLHERGSFNVVVPAGNAYNLNCHARLQVASDGLARLPFMVAPDCRHDTFLELWYSGSDTVSVAIQPPSEASSLSVVGGNQVAVWRNAMYGREAPALTIANVRAVSANVDMNGRSVQNHVVLVAINPTTSLSGEATQQQDTKDHDIYGATETVESKARSRPLAPAGIWELHITSSSQTGVQVDAWIERSDVVMGELRKGQQASFLAPLQQDDQMPYSTDQPVTKSATLNSFGHGRNVIVAGGAISNLERYDSLHNESSWDIAPYSGEGPRRMEVRGDLPSDFALSDEGWSLPGVLAAGNRSMAFARRNGTSVAAPSIARKMLNQNSATVSSGSSNGAASKHRPPRRTVTSSQIT